MAIEDTPYRDFESRSSIVKSIVNCHISSELVRQKFVNLETPRSILYRFHASSLYGSECMELACCWIFWFGS